MTVKMTFVLDLNLNGTKHLESIRDISTVQQRKSNVHMSVRMDGKDR